MMNRMRQTKRSLDKQEEHKQIVMFTSCSNLIHKNKQIFYSTCVRELILDKTNMTETSIK